jgi:iron complex transport system substrate-binding protein
MKTKFKNILLTIIMATTIITFIGANGVKESDVSLSNNAQQEFAISFIDDDGVQINLDKPCERIIALYTAHVENIYYLGAGDQLLGGYTSAIYPPEALEKANYTYKGDAETIIAANPDCVLIRPFIAKKAPQLIEQLKMAGIPVVSLYPDTFEGFEVYIEKLGMLLGKEDTAKSMLSEFYKNLDEIHEITSTIEDKQTVFFESTDKNVRTVSPDSMPARAIEIAGGINLASDVKPMTEGSSIASFGIERVITNALNIDVYISQVGAMNAGGNIITVSQRPGFDTIKAIKDGRFYNLSEKLISSPTFRYYKGVKEIARYLYPDVIDDISDFENDNVCNNSDFASIIMMMNHLPLYSPTSSKYYTKTILGHTYGFFEDLKWDDDNFDAIETAVYSGLAPFTTINGKEYYYPNKDVTRDQLASTLYLMGEFNTLDNHINISDLGNCEVPKIVQKLVDHKIMFLDGDGNFNPQDTVTNNEVINAMKLALEAK